ncbi:hypothetical protein AAVH_09005 [Aphelenchoides avenae]|nr:hypothetical protein AAVH_09005 [Aphelenchus avenae]
MHPMGFNPERSLCEYASASYHLPGAYIEFFPCPHCTYNDEEGRTSFVEVFHFPNVHEPNICITLTFVMPAEPLVALLTDTDVCIEVLRCLPRSDLEKMLLVSRRWSNVIRENESSLQRRSFYVHIMFYGESPGMLSVHFYRIVCREQCRVLRVLTTRGLLHALDVVRLHLRNAFVEGALPYFLDSAPPPSLPRKMLVNIPLSVRVDWLKSLLRSMPHNSEIRTWAVADLVTGFDSVLPLAHCALEPHRKLHRVQELELGLANSPVTWEQLASLLNEPSIRGFAEITLWTTTEAIDTSELRAILSSWHSLKLHVLVTGETALQDALLTLPTQIIQDFVALRDVSRFVDEFSLRLVEPEDVAFSEMPDVDEATDRRKQFRHHLKDVGTVVRTSVYVNPVAHKELTVVTFDDFRGTVRFFNGNISPAELKQVLKRPYTLY